MELVRYKPGEALRWFEIGAKDMMARAKKKGETVLSNTSGRQIKKDLATVAGAVLDAGKGAVADLVHRQALATEYVLGEKGLEIVRPNGVTFVAYSSISTIEQRGDETIIYHDSGKIAIKPLAYLVSGRLRVPVGWSRNGMEVAYGVLADELAARSKVNITLS